MGLKAAVRVFAKYLTEDEMCDATNVEYSCCFCLAKNDIFSIENASFISCFHFLPSQPFKKSYGLRV